MQGTLSQVPPAAKSAKPCESTNLYSHQGADIRQGQQTVAETTAGMVEKEHQTADKCTVVALNLQEPSSSLQFGDDVEKGRYHETVSVTYHSLFSSYWCTPGNEQNIKRVKDLPTDVHIQMHKSFTPLTDSRILPSHPKSESFQSPKDGLSFEEETMPQRKQVKADSSMQAFISPKPTVHMQLASCRCWTSWGIDCTATRHTDC